MNISLEQVAEILSTTQDEVMYLHQTNKLGAGVNQDTLSWEFNLDEVLKLKSDIDKESEEENSDME